MIVAILRPNMVGTMGAIAAALVFAVVIGAINGIVVGKTGLPSFIVTLAMLFMVRGATIGSPGKSPDVPRLEAQGAPRF